MNNETSTSKNDTVYLGYFENKKDDYIIPVYILASSKADAKTKLKEIEIFGYNLVETNIKYYCKIYNLGNIREKNKLIKNGYLQFKKER